MSQPLVSVIMGSTSDLKIMQNAADLLEQLNARRKSGSAVVITSHSPDLIAWAKVSGGRVWNIEQGRLMEVSS